MFDILLSHTDEAENPLYLQIYQKFREHIINGVIPCNTKLPSIRALQLQMNISKTPIETAYQMLLAEGYAYSKPRSGYYAVNMDEFPFPHPKKSPASLVHTSSSNELSANQKFVIDFDPSAIDNELFPIRTWKKIFHNALEEYSQSIGQYGDMMGEYCLRKSIADYLRKSRGVVCTPEQIVIGSGISYSIMLLSKLLNGIRYIAFEEPGFEPVREQFIQNGYEIIPIEINDHCFRLQKLEESNAQMIYVTPSHQFPTGRVMPYAEREYLLQWANKHNTFIIEDDYDGEFRYLGKPIPSLQSLDYQGRVIYIGTFSKAFTPALRMNYMVIPEKFLSKITKINHFLSCPSRIDQWAMHTFIDQGHWYRHIRRMRNKYRKKHSTLVDCIQTHFKNTVEITGHSAGLHIQITVKTKLDARSLLNLAADKGVRVYDFRQMWMSTAASGYPRIYLGFAGLNEADMEKGIRLLKEAWANVLVENEN